MLDTPGHVTDQAIVSWSVEHHTLKGEHSIMSKGTIPPTPASERRKSSSAPLQSYTRRKATYFDGKHNDKPIIFNIGKNKTAAERARIQRRLYLSFAAVMVAAIILVAVYGILDVKVIQPNRSIATVNGAQIPQYSYRMMVAYLAQDTWSQLQAATAFQNALSVQAAKDPSKAATLNAQISAVQSQISSLQTSFTQTSVDQLAIDHLIEDKLIISATTQFKRSDPKAGAALNVTQAQTDQAFKDFKSHFPKGQSLGAFESQNNMSDSDVKAALNVILRRNAMDLYLQSRIVSPQLQVHLKRIQVDSLAKANTDRAAVVKDPTTWGDLAKKDSLDVNSRDNGGDLGWIVQGQQDQNIELWAFGNPTIGTISPIIKDIGGTFNIVQLVERDPARAVSADTITTLKNNALSHWLTGQKYLPSANIPAYDQDMYTSTDNVPKTPIFVPFTSAAPANPVPVVPTP